MRYLPLDHNDVICQVKDYIWHKRNFRQQGLTAAAVARELGISRSFMLRVFKEDMGVSFLDYVNECRVRHARKMVVQNHGRFPMEHIQVMAGFGSLHTFYAKYKASYGELPTVTDARQTSKQ